MVDQPETGHVKQPSSLNLAASPGLVDPGRLGEGFGRHLLSDITRTTSGEHVPEDGIDVGLEHHRKRMAGGLDTSRGDSLNCSVLHTYMIVAFGDLLSIDDRFLTIRTIF